MILGELTLQNFRNHKAAKYQFDPKVTLIIGPNTAGKSNLIESIVFLSTGKSFRAEKDDEAIEFGQNLAKVKAEVLSGDQVINLELIITPGAVLGRKTASKKFLVNGVSKKRQDFMGNLISVLFSPQDLDIIIDSPSLRRHFLDQVLEQVDREYRLALIAYTKSLRQRNALLEKAREEGIRNEKQFEYWDNLLIENGQIISQKRQAFLDFVNLTQKEIFDFTAFYDKSVISQARLLQYKDAEIGSGVTLVGPHRDDFSLSMFDDKENTTHDIKLYGSRGQQRLAILQLKVLQVQYIKEKIKEKPVLLLDDIFSELDENHIELVLEMFGEQQTILTTTHREFLPKKLLNKVKIIEIKNNLLK